MNLSLIIAGIQKAIQYEPQIAAIITALFKSGVPTEEQWAQAKLKALELDYDKSVPESQRLQQLADEGKLA